MPSSGLLDHMVALLLVFWIKKMWFVYTVEYYTAIRRNKIGLFVDTWMNLRTVIQSEIREREKQISYVNIYVESRTMVQMILFAKPGSFEGMCRSSSQSSGGEGLPYSVFLVFGFMFE